MNRMRKCEGLSTMCEKRSEMVMLKLNEKLPPVMNTAMG